MKRHKNKITIHNSQRREFLKAAGAGTAILMTMGFHGWAEAPLGNQPFHPGLLLPGIYGYPGSESVEAGKSINSISAVHSPTALPSVSSERK
jgi:hypothetical protein